MNTSVALRPQFGTKRLFLWMLFFSLYSTVFSVLPATTLSFSIATCVAATFVVLDALLPLQYRFAGFLGISYFTCGLAFAIAAGFWSLVFFPPMTPPKPPMPFWTGLYHLVSGGVYRDFLQEIAIVAHYTMTILCCTFISVVIALARLRRERAAKWLLLLNSPGLLFTAYVVFEDFYTG
jgi:hypothetical protein